jgi:predicted O-methyltransferase YrrM
VVNYFQCVQILEIGNSLGMSTTYLAAANGDAAVLNLINSENTKDSINQNELIDHYNIIIKVYDSPLEIYLSKLNIHFDLAILHLSEINTIETIEAIFTKLKPSSVLILTHIHENVENYSCWTKTKEHQSVTCAIELYGMGFLFFRNEFMEKQYYTVRF